MTNDRQINREGDVVLIHYEGKPALYARIEVIRPDIKKDWYQVTLLLLTIPARTVTWILREEYINGAPFTMGGQSMRLEGIKKVSLPEKQEDVEKSFERKGFEKTAKVIPFKKE